MSLFRRENFLQLQALICPDDCYSPGKEVALETPGDIRAGKVRFISAQEFLGAHGKGFQTAQWYDRKGVGDRAGYGGNRRNACLGVDSDPFQPMATKLISGGSWAGHRARAAAVV